MAKAVAGALRDSGFCKCIILARNESAGQGQCYDWLSELGDVRPGALIYATPFGIAGGPQAETLAYEPAAIDQARVVIDAVALPPETPLIQYARAAGKSVITGSEVVTLKTVEQFARYTGVRPSGEQIRRAAKWNQS